MDLTEIQVKQKEFILARKWERFNATQVFAHLIEELGEVGSHLLYKEKYKIKGAGHKGETDDIQKEFAQAFNLFLQLCILSNVDLELAWKNEYKRNLQRFDENLWRELAEEDTKFST